jgi:hypothetical protein
MSKMKELDSIAEAVASHLDEIITDSIDWAVDGTIVDTLEGDEYNEACNHIVQSALMKLLHT